MSRKFASKIRGRGSIRPSPVIVMIVEGWNVTETLYFRQYQQPHRGYTVRLLASGSSTDPSGMLEKLKIYWNQNGLSSGNGDRAFVVLDLDCDDRKGKVIKKLEAGSENIRFIVSNPCFEVWFLLHFRYTTHVFANGAEVIQELRRFISDYEKNRDINDQLAGHMETAYENARKLVSYFEENGAQWPSNECNPRTDVPEILELISKLDNRQSTP